MNLIVLDSRVGHISLDVTAECRYEVHSGYPFEDCEWTKCTERVHLSETFQETHYRFDPLMISCALYDKFSTKWQIHSKGSCES